MYELERPPFCSVGRAMEILGERWTMLIMREAFYGVRRFSDMQRNLGIARNILSTRLQTLVRAGILERRLYHEEPERCRHDSHDAQRALRRLQEVGHGLLGGSRECRQDQALESEQETKRREQIGHESASPSAAKARGP